MLKDVRWINSMSLRASFGSQGDVPSVPTRLVIKEGGYDKYFDSYSKSINKWPNPDLKWEKTYTTNIGLDFALFKRKITGTIEWYYRKTTDAYMSQSVSEVNGITSYTVNRGTLTDQGLDLTLNFTPINRLTEVNGEIKELRWRFDPSLGSVINQLIDKAVQTPETTLKHDNEIYYSEYLNGTIHVVGRPINGFYSYRFTGLDGKDGRPTFDNFSQMVTVTDPQTGEQTEITRAKWLNGISTPTSSVT
ncbi:MAG: TonB-dependent receptor [Alistipes senegalensis]